MTLATAVAPPAGGMPDEEAEIVAMKKSDFFCWLIAAALPSTSLATTKGWSR